MKYPLIICARGTLIIAAEGFFKGIGALDLAAGTLEMNVTREGKAGFAWMLDTEATFWEFESLGLLPRNLMQRLGLARAREAFRVVPGRRIAAGELRERLAGLEDRLVEAPNVADLTALLAPLPAAQVLGSAEMRSYLQL